MTAPRPTPGTDARFIWRKWNGANHWEHECVYLGHDEFGEWFGQPKGARSSRPGRDVTVDVENVTLMPPSGEYALTMNGPAHRTRVYIDLGWDVRWSDTDPATAEGIDMDLDVVHTRDKRGLWIDDRDEWDEHRVKYGYPLDVVARLEHLAVDLERRVGAHEAPFNEAVAEHWLAVLARLRPA